MTKPPDELQVLLNDYNLRRSEIFEMMKMVDRGIFVLVTSCAALAGLSLDKGLLSNTFTQFALIFGISQLQIFICFYVAAATSVMSANAGYIEAIEIAINALFPRKLALWENTVVQRVMFGRLSSYLIALIGIFLLIGTLNVLLVRNAFADGKTAYAWLLLAEIAVVIYAFANCLRDRSKAREGGTSRV